MEGRNVDRITKKVFKGGINTDTDSGEHGVTILSKKIAQLLLTFDQCCWYTGELQHWRFIFFDQ